MTYSGYAVSLLMAGQLGMSPDIIEKGKKYIQPGQRPPKGVTIHEGPNGGKFYYIEDKHVRQNGMEHELVRSRGVTKDQFKEIEEKYRAEGAESVHFVHKPGLERDAHGNYLYNIYVNYGNKTQKKISDKKAADKARYGHPRVKDIEEPEYTEKDSVHSTPAYNHSTKGIQRPVQL